MSSHYLLQQKACVKKLENFFRQDSHKSTIVNMQKDYINDDQICLTSVAFIPSHISAEIIKNISNPLRKIEADHYFYPPGSLHVTIKNVRTINNPPLFTTSGVKKVNEVFNKIISKFPIFEFSVEDVLVFPTSLSVMAYSSAIFQKLVLLLDETLKEIGVPDNKKYFSDSVLWGNITICRFIQKPGDRFIALARKMRDLEIGKFRVEKISLITCNAVCHVESRKIIAEYKLKRHAL
jgi:2'-5' RNA ligase